MSEALTREQKLEAALRRLRTITGLLAEELDLEPSECVVAIRIKGDNDSKDLVRISLADCFLESDMLIDLENVTIP